jgi:plastocyanin
MKKSWLIIAAVIIAITAIFVIGSVRNAQQQAAAKKAVNVWALSANNTTVIIDGFGYFPAVLNITRGTTVTWMNKYPVAHRVTADNGSSVNFSSASLSTGATFVFTFNDPGNFTYHCDLHPTMKGAINVK